MSETSEKLHAHVEKRGGPQIDNGVWQLMLDAADEIETYELLREQDVWLEQALLHLLYENGIQPSSADILKASSRRREALDKLAKHDQEILGD